MKSYLVFVLFFIGILHGLSTAFAKPLANNATELITAKNKHASMLADKDGDHLSDGLQARMAGMAASHNVDVIVTFRGAQNNQSHVVATENAIGAFTLHREFTIIHGFKATMTVGQARALSRNPNVFRIEESVIVTTQLSGANSDFGAITARSDFGVNGQDIGICFVDTGIDASHEQLFGREITFFDAVAGLAAPYDDHGHGTHTATIALGQGGSGIYSAIMGVAPAASVFAAKVLGSDGSGDSSQIIAGIEFCAAQDNVQIISMSVGTIAASDGLDAMSMAVNCASDPNYNTIAADPPYSCNTSNNAKIVVVAAGNSGPGPGTISSPGAAEKAITVGAVANYSEDGRGVYLAAFSGRGPISDGRIKPDISAPGVRITSAQAGGGYVIYSGTSMATPYVAGTIALMLQDNPAIMNSTIPVDELLPLLSNSAQDRGVLDADNNPIKPDNEYGAGVIDVNRAVALASGTDVTPTALPSYYREVGSIDVSGGSTILGPFHITADDISNGIPLSATVTIEGDIICLAYISDICILERWSPDLDVYLLDSNYNIVNGGIGDITVSECAASGEACGLSRQETLFLMPTSEGDYFIQIVSLGGTASFLLEVSQGPFAGTPPVNNNPFASFTEDCNNSLCNFTDSSTAINTIVAWDWSFGDENSSTAANPTYTYSAAGTYTITLMVTDNLGRTNTTSHEVIALTGGTCSSPDSAINTSPADGAPNVNTSTTLTWTAGNNAISHLVYFGSSTPPPLQNEQVTTTFDPGTLSFNTTYFWRIDEINSIGTTPGPVWSFTTASAPEPNLLTVDSITLSTVSSRGNKNGLATITVRDNLGNLVPNAMVTGTFTGTFTGTASDNTDAAGTAIINAEGTAKKNIAFAFCIDSITHSSLTYTPPQGQDCSSF